MGEINVDKVLKQIAKRNNVPVAVVKYEMMKSMKEALQNPDPAVQAAWKEIKGDAEEITLEVFLEHILSESARFTGKTVKKGDDFEQ